MAKPHTITQLTLEPREDVGTTAAHRIRREGKIPGVVYGHAVKRQLCLHRGLAGMQISHVERGSNRLLGLRSAMRFPCPASRDLKNLIGRRRITRGHLL